MSESKVPENRIGRERLLEIVRRAAGANRLEEQYQKHLSDLQNRLVIKGLEEEIKDLSDEEKAAEMIARVIGLMVSMSTPQAQATLVWHLYVHLRAAGVMDAVPHQPALIVPQMRIENPKVKP